MKVDVAPDSARQFLELFRNVLELSRLDALASPLVCFRSPHACVQGSERFKEYLRTWLRSFSDMTHTVDVLLADERSAVIRGVWRGLHDGTFNGIKPSHRRVSLPFVLLLRFEGDWITDVELFYDSQTLLSEISCVHPQVIR